jgi:hypothetical protein
MLTPHFLFAAVESFKPESLPQGGGIVHKNSAGGDMLLILAIGVGLAAILFTIVYLSRQKRARRLGTVRSSRVLYREDKTTKQSSGRMKMRKKRRSHPDNLPRNPTLGETGGLPPLRPEEPSENIL